LFILNRHTIEEVDGSLAASLSALNRVAVFTFTQLGAFEQLTRSFFVLATFFTLSVAQYLQYTSGKTMVYSLTYSQLKTTCSMARYYSGKFPSAKKYHNCTFKYILEVVQGEIKTVIFDSTAQHQSSRQQCQNLFDIPVPWCYYLLSAIVRPSHSQRSVVPSGPQGIFTNSRFARHVLDDPCYGELRCYRSPRTLSRIRRVHLRYVHIDNRVLGNSPKL
jgi:hypothetical protein